MIRRYNRHYSVAQEIQKNIANILQNRINDRRIIDNMITVSNVEISNDLLYAKIYVTFLNHQEDNKIQDSIKLLQKASGYISYLLGKSMRLRIATKLTFFYDYSLIEGIRINNLLNKTVNCSNNE